MYKSWRMIFLSFFRPHRNVNCLSYLLNHEEKKKIHMFLLDDKVSHVLRNKCFRSRLGCQVIARPELDGLRLAIPSATRNFAVDRFVLYSGTLEPEAAQPHRDDYCSFDNFDGCLLRENSVITYLWSCLCVSFSVWFLTQTFKQFFLDDCHWQKAWFL